MSAFQTTRIPDEPSDIAPDGADVRVLLDLQGGGMALFELAPGNVSRAVMHRSVEEIWLFLSGRGEMWRKQDGREEIVPVERGVCLSIPLGTHFQYRALGDMPLTAVAVTMPPWPGEKEAIHVEGVWRSKVS